MEKLVSMEININPEVLITLFREAAESDCGDSWCCLGFLCDAGRDKTEASGAVV